MKFERNSCPRVLPLLLASLLVACSDENPESMLTSAKGYLAKNDNKAAIIEIKNALQKNPNLAEARYLLGKAMLDGGDAMAAEVELRKAASLNFPPAQLSPVLARAMLQQGKFKKLVDEFGKVDPGAGESSTDLRTTIGVAQASMGDIENSEKTLAAALAAKPDFTPALVAQARLKATRGDFPGAAGIIESVLAKAPNDAEAWKLKGDLHDLQRQVEPAAMAFRKAVEIQPRNLGAHAALISLLMREGKTDDAAAQIELLKKAAPSHPAALLLEAQYQFHKQDKVRARDLVQQFLKAVPDSPQGLQLAGEIELRSGSFAQAEAFLGKLVRMAPDNIGARRLLAMTYLRLGKPDSALSSIEPILDKTDQDSNLLALAGEILMQTGDVGKAEKYFSRAASLDPKNVPKRTALALTHLQQGSSSAFNELEQIAATDEGTQADITLIAASMRQKNFDKALKAIDALEIKQPKTPLPHHLRGGVFLGKKDLAAARRSFEHALSTNPAYLPSAAALAMLDMSEKKADAARKRFESVLAADPKNMQARLALASLALQTGAPTDEVERLVGKAVVDHPSETGPRLALIDLYLRGKDPKKAVIAAQEALAALPDRAELLKALASAQMAAGESNQALSTFDKLARLQPNSPVPFLGRAQVQAIAKDNQAATESLRKALEIKPDLIEAQTALVALYLQAGSRDQALALARDVQRQRPKEAVGFVLEGDVRASMRSWADAEAAYRNGIRLAPSAEIAMKLHSALLAGNNRPEASRVAASWLKDHPKETRFRQYLGDRAIASNDLESAAQQYRAIIELQPDHPVALNNLAWIAAQQKNPRALEYAEKANKLAPNSPAIMDTLGMLLLEAGNSGRAVDLLKKATEGAPQEPNIRLNFAKVLMATGDKTGARRELEVLAKLGDKFPKQAEVARALKEL